MHLQLSATGLITALQYIYIHPPKFSLRMALKSRNT